MQFSVSCSQLTCRYEYVSICYIIYCLDLFFSSFVYIFLGFICLLIYLTPQFNHWLTSWTSIPVTRLKDRSTSSLGLITMFIIGSTTICTAHAINLQYFQHQSFFFFLAFLKGKKNFVRTIFYEISISYNKTHL